MQKFILHYPKHIRTTLLGLLRVELKPHFFFLSWVHRGQNLRPRQAKEQDVTYGNQRNSQIDKPITAATFLPFSFGLGGEVDARKMKPLDRTLENETRAEYKNQADTDGSKTPGEANTYIWVVASNHLSIRHLVTQAVGGLVGVDRHVQDVRRLHGQEGVTQIWAAHQAQMGN